MNITQLPTSPITPLNQSNIIGNLHINTYNNMHNAHNTNVANAITNNSNTIRPII